MVKHPFSIVCLNSVLNVKVLVGAFNQEKALVGAFSVIVKSGCPVVEPMEHYTALVVAEAVCVVSLCTGNKVNHSPHAIAISSPPSS